MPLIIFSPVRAFSYFFGFMLSQIAAHLQGPGSSKCGANLRHIAWNLAVAGFHFRNISVRCEQSCSNSPLATGAGSATKGGVAMSESDQFRQYAEEAMLWVSRSKNEEEKQILVELLCTWTAAAVASDALGSQWQSAISQSPVRDFDCCLVT